MDKTQRSYREKNEKDFVLWIHYLVSPCANCSDTDLRYKWEKVKDAIEEVADHLGVVYEIKS